MARYCFYCGCELASGEKCNCRLKKDQSTAYEQNAAENTFDSTVSSGFNKSADEPVFSEKQPPNKKKEEAFNHNNFRYRVSTAKDQISALFPLILQSLLYTGHYFTRPATKIRQESIRLRRHSAIPTMISLCGLTGFLCTIMLTDGSPTFSIFISSIGLRSIPLRQNPLFSFFFFSIVIAIWFALVCLGFYIASIITKKKLRIRRILDLASIPIIYVLAAEILILFTFFQFGGSGSLTLFVAGASILCLGNHSCFKNILDLQENHAVFFVLFPYLISTIIFRIIFYTLAPHIIALI